MTHLPHYQAVSAVQVPEDEPMLGNGTSLPDGMSEAINGDPSLTPEEIAEKVKQGQDDFKVRTASSLLRVQKHLHGIGQALYHSLAASVCTAARAHTCSACHLQLLACVQVVHKQPCGKNRFCALPSHLSSMIYLSQPEWDTTGLD